MILHAAHRPDDDTTAQATPLQVDCDDFATGRDQLHALVPDGHKLLYIRTS